MKKEESILLNIIKKYAEKQGRPVPGKKALQKLVYFSQVEGLPVGFDYILYKYGPYSYELEDKIKEMEFFEQINLSQSDAGYEITTSRDTPFLGREEDEIIDTVIKRLGSFSPRELELLSTVHFIATDMMEIYHESDMGEILRRVKSIKRGKFSWEEIEGAYKRLKEWQLI